MKKTIVISLFAVIATIFVSCKMDHQNRYIGVWERVSFSNPDSADRRSEWTFYAGDKLEIATVYIEGRKKDSTLNDTINFEQYVYSTEGHTLNIYGINGDEDYDPASGNIRGNYWVDELKKGKRIKMTRRQHPDGSTGAAFYRIELTKK
ncbi:MAG: hypothetical protein MJ069_06300 [Salinivirgaceae bacterium]|nr:hypothetical protein [Salinivirgaceae bacterium]